jgi:hypothetical protein
VSKTTNVSPRKLAQQHLNEITNNKQGRTAAQLIFEMKGRKLIIESDCEIENNLP